MSRDLQRLVGFAPAGRGESAQRGITVGAGTFFILAVGISVLKARAFNMHPAPFQAAAAVSNIGCNAGFFQQSITTR